MQIHPFTFRRFALISGFCSLLLICGGTARAQNTRPPESNFTSLSDVSGPFLGNVQTGTTPLPSPTSAITSVSSIDTLSRELILSPPELNLGEVTKVCVHLAFNMDKMSPFAGCSDVNWAAYNRAVRDAKQLNRELLRAVQLQNAALKANPSPQAREAMGRQLGLIERTTTSLELATTTLVIYGKALDFAR